MKRLPSNVTEVSDGVFLLRLPQPFYGQVNSYLLKGEGGTTLIDAGHPSDSSTLLKTLKAAGCPPEEITQIIYTHPHVDHFGGGGAFSQWTVIRHVVYQDALSDLQDYGSYLERVRENNAHRAEPFLSSFQDGSRDRSAVFSRKDLDSYCRKYFPDVKGPSKLTPMGAGETIKAGGFSLRIVPTPGHSPSHICLYDARRRYLFCGDMVVGRSTSIQDVNPYLRSLQKLRDLKPSFLLPGHGPVRRHPGRVLQSAMRDVQQKEKILNRVLRGEPRTLPEIVMRVKRGTHLSLVDYLSISRWIFAFIEKFEREGRVRWEEKEGRVFYSLR